ncbi:MAG: hypothetical protein ACPGVB_06615 [Chitinophagales bacterium]
MKNVLIILTLLFTSHFFNDLQAQAKIGLVSTTGGDKIDIGKGGYFNKIHLHYFKALSKDDCETNITLIGKVEVVDIPELVSNQHPNKFAIKNRGKKYRRSTSTSSSHSASSSLSAGENAPAYARYNIPATTVKGSMITFDNSEQESLTKFGSRFYIIFTFKDKDNCTRNSEQPIDLNPQEGTYETLKLYVNTSANEVRLATNGELTGAVLAGINEYFTVKGNLNAPANVEVGEIRLKILRKKKNMSPGNFESNGG